VETIRTAIDRSDAVVITGGIGPTQDDVTREAIAVATGREMVRDADYAQALRDRWETLGRVMPENNLRQADRPVGAEQLPNPAGSAPGIALEHDGTWIFALPGVPAEMHLLIRDHVLPRLRVAAGETGVVKSRIIRTWGRSESQVAEMLDDLFMATTNPSVAFLASAGEIKVRVTAKAESDAEADALIAPVEAAVRDRLGSSVFGADDETIHLVVQRLLERKGWTIATAESATAGLVTAALTQTPGASKVVVGGITAYSAEAKTSLLGVSAELLAAEGVVSEAAALAMAEGARARFGADVGVAVTGEAGPDPAEQPVGTMVIAVVTPDGMGSRTMRLPGDRERIRTYTTTAALQLVRLAVSGQWWAP
ncbi:MAG: CinA family nicotinamide mononucleotide deamidase-related protein, partial [Acidimicrobiia bacterium]|nr:CinA family nicotinamide mononucleotide deamidase-related protein [Acidimicrobiia bacterium]